MERRSSDSPSVGNGWQTSAISNIKSLLVAGTNVIAIEGINDGGNASGVIAVAQLDTTRIVTDGTWKALPGTPADAAHRVEHDQLRRLRRGRRRLCTGPYGIGPWGTGIQDPAGPLEGLRLRDHHLRVVEDHHGGDCGRRRLTSGTPRSSTPDGTVESEGDNTPRLTPTSSREVVRRRTSRSTAGRAIGTSRSGPHRAAPAADHPVGQGRGGAHRPAHGRHLHQLEQPAEHHARPR